MGHPVPQVCAELQQQPSQSNMPYAADGGELRPRFFDSRAPRTRPGRPLALLPLRFPRTMRYLRSLQALQAIPAPPTPGAPTPGAPTPGAPTPGAPTPAAPAPVAPKTVAPKPATPMTGTSASTPTATNSIVEAQAVRGRSQDLAKQTKRTQTLLGLQDLRNLEFRPGRSDMNWTRAVNVEAALMTFTGDLCRSH
ncbi:hypothetical protein VTK56DRAFT_2485 [Thermocarpiscus australiensis]